MVMGVDRGLDARDDHSQGHENAHAEVSIFVCPVQRTRHGIYVRVD